MLEPLHFTDAEKAAYRVTYAPTATDDQWNLFINECQRRALVPGIHVVFNLRDAREYNKELKQTVYVKKVALITTINALRLIAERAGHYDGHEPFIYYYLEEGGNLKDSKIPLGKIPHAVSVEGFRKDWKHSAFATARYDAYVQTKDDGGKKVPTLMWATRGEEQLAKCAEAQMLRTIAPEECAGLLITEELGNDAIDREESKEEQSLTPAVIPQPITAPAVNQAAAPSVAVGGTGFWHGEQGAGREASAQVTAPAPAVEAKPQPVTASPAQVTPAPEPGGLFANTTHPPPEMETTRFPRDGYTLTEKPANLPTPAASPAPAAATPAQPTTAAQPVAAAPTGDAPADLKTFNDLTSRAAKIVRDKLPKSGMKETEAASLVKNYLLKGSGSASIRAIGALAFEKLVKNLEEATPEQAAATVREFK